MTNPAEISPSTLPRVLRAVFSLTVFCALVLVGLQPGQAQTFTVLHSFTDGADGGNPSSGLTMDRAGNLYGTASGYLANVASVFQLKSVGGGWVFNPLFDFTQNNFRTDGYGLAGKVVFGPDGALYGAAETGGNFGCEHRGCGTIFELQPPSTFCRSVLCGWNITVLFDFSGDAGFSPDQIVFGPDGNIYGTTLGSGNPQGNCDQDACGTVYELADSGRGTWTMNILYEFHGSDGNLPMGGVIFDSAGNLYGITRYGGSDNLGVVYKLSPASGFWTQTILHTFQGGSDGQDPGWPLTMDAAGNLYGVTGIGGSGGYGTAFELTPPGTWNLQTLYNFSAGEGVPNGGLLLDSSGNIYGTTFANSDNTGIVFKLKFTNGTWSLTDLHDFSQSEGFRPNGSLIFDAQGNLYGTAFEGAYGFGTVWKLTP